jgi:predicted O-methyltransferase YrrM
MDPHRALRPLRRALSSLRRVLSSLRRALRSLRRALGRATGELVALLRPPDTEHIAYLMLLDRIHALLRPRTYFEIGVAKGYSLAQVRLPTLALGVDPAMNIAVPIRVRAKFFRLSSDEFFRDRDVRAELEGQPVDMAFIDGLHLFEQVLRDFINLERFCTPGSVILLHDCLPRDRATSTREQRTKFWTGDVWKMVPCLSRYRPDLLVQTLDVPPAGLTVIRNLDPSSMVLPDLYDRLCEEFIPLDYEDLVAAGKSATLNIVGHDWRTVCKVFGATRTPLRSRLGGLIGMRGA